MSKWLIDTFDNINVHSYDDFAFKWSCVYGNLDTSKWLIDTFDNINVHDDNDFTFTYICENGHLETLKWLCDIIPDIRVNNDNFLKIANDKKRYKLIEYICNLSPYYVCEYLDDQVCCYSIREYINVKG